MPTIGIVEYDSDDDDDDDDDKSSLFSLIK